MDKQARTGHSVEQNPHIRKTLFLASTIIPVADNPITIDFAARASLLAFLDSALPVEKLTTELSGKSHCTAIPSKRVRCCLLRQVILRFTHPPIRQFYLIACLKLRPMLSVFNHCALKA